MDWLLNRTGLSGGIYRGFLTGPSGAPPVLEAMLGSQVLGALEVHEAKGGWRVEADLGTSAMTEGVQTIVIRTGDGVQMDSITLIVGLDPEHDIRGELEAMRIELAQLKRAFRRHVEETT